MESPSSRSGHPLPRARRIVVTLMSSACPAPRGGGRETEKDDDRRGALVRALASPLAERASCRGGRRWRCRRDATGGARRRRLHVADGGEGPAEVFAAISAASGGSRGASDPLGGRFAALPGDRDGTLYRAAEAADCRYLPRRTRPDGGVSGVSLRYCWPRRRAGGPILVGWATPRRSTAGGVARGRGASRGQRAARPV